MTIAPTCTGRRDALPAGTTCSWEPYEANEARRRPDEPELTVETLKDLTVDRADADEVKGGPTTLARFECDDTM